MTEPDWMALIDKDSKGVLVHWIPVEVFEKFLKMEKTVDYRRHDTAGSTHTDQQDIR